MGKTVTKSFNGKNLQQCGFLFLKANRLQWVVCPIHVYDYYFQLSSSLKLLGHSKPNFIWSLVGKKGQRFVKNSLGHMTKSAAMPKTFKNLPLQPEVPSS